MWEAHHEETVQTARPTAHHPGAAPFGCTRACCQPSGLSQSGDFGARSWPRSPAWSTSLRHSGPRAVPATAAAVAAAAVAAPPIAWRTPEKPEFAAVARPPPGGAWAVGPPSRARPCAAAEGGAAEGGAGDAGEPSTVERACSLLEQLVGPCPDLCVRQDEVFAPIFHSVSVPVISGADYLVHHLLKLGLQNKEHLAEPIVLHAFLLIDRLLHFQNDRGFHLCTSNVHRILLATVLLSAKLLDDECYNNAYWATIGGVALSHLNQLEVQTMSLLNHSLLVTGAALDSARARLFSRSSAAAGS
jgi:hypothetical protein